MTKKDVPLEQHVGAKLYYELGLAITQWAHVQDDLLRVFNKLMGGTNFHLASAIFYTPINDKIRADIVDNAAKVMLAGSPLLEEWKILRRHLKEKGDRRNMLAHLMALHDPNNPEKSFLRPHLFNFNVRHKYSNKPIPSYTAKQIEEMSRSFGRLSQNLEDFAQKIPQTLKQPQQHDS